MSPQGLQLERINNIGTTGDSAYMGLSPTALTPRQDPNLKHVRPTSPRNHRTRVRMMCAVPIPARRRSKSLAQKQGPGPNLTHCWSRNILRLLIGWSLSAIHTFFPQTRPASPGVTHSLALSPCSVTGEAPMRESKPIS